MRSDGQLMDLVNREIDALLRWPLSQASLAGSRRIHPSERVPQEVELPFRNLADPCFVLVHRPSAGDSELFGLSAIFRSPLYQLFHKAGEAMEEVVTTRLKL